MSKKLPTNCPACTSQLAVQALRCENCQTTVNGNFDLPLLLQLEADEIDFLMRFLKSSGSLKSMARQLGYSYPKVRNMLDDLINKVQSIENKIKDTNEE